ncbi:hypothetical protein [Deinococcus soli (ex Cha et al. 2016)]|uniref:Uncharacterized protein n=2 Tax=Deinococcus soli (ex Cha et al. 2016) TaxID=1309411 RepID=A0AAE4BQ33_9DEIO|nr:hypothetical protein [Deinococcus soli (ex Cha et al. 2016)]MDR6220834.1 hypothetical protein [Deinococcus soli (ex Cha et al. 2016)]MDR6330828.1 hypothetical protein [Deinococcus soli (ex Cha et al. 2016)]MDR6753933.1 hypothetical protein [Deinococcus soli (ex Cha et al. 2016)]
MNTVRWTREELLRAMKAYITRHAHVPTRAHYDRTRGAGPDARTITLRLGRWKGAWQTALTETIHASPGAPAGRLTLPSRPSPRGRARLALLQDLADAEAALRLGQLLIDANPKPSDLSVTCYVASLPEPHLVFHARQRGDRWAAHVTCPISALRAGPDPARRALRNLLHLNPDNLST